LAHQQTVGFDLPIRTPALLITVGESEQASGAERGLERLHQTRVDISEPRIPRRFTNQDPLSQRPQLGCPGGGEGSFNLAERVLCTSGEGDRLGGAGNLYGDDECDDLAGAEL